MSRRTATLVVSGLLLLALACAVLFAPVPYAELSPGPTYNTLGDEGGKPVIEVSGHETYPTSGHLNMTTVSVTNKSYDMPLLDALAGWVKGDADVVLKKSLYPDDKSAAEVERENAEEFSSSQEHAKVAAFAALGIPIEKQVIVATVAKDAPALGKLHAGDIILAVDGKPITKTEEVAAAITKHRAGESVTLTVDPADARGTRRDVQVVTGKAEDDGRALVGITPGILPKFPFKVEIHLEDVGGPSAGMMFALGIVDKLSPGDLTGGKFVAGTGTIDDEGKVGAIGGIQMKTIGARRQGAKYFLTPKANCAAAAQTKPGGLTLVQVETLDDALKALETIRTGQGTLTECHA
ncbi:PDZ domain-containing protein [Embleya sp. NPDC005575]|uniref:YlbL family protein n=1 Tax=Embleya sp. NPDC005575 TaxID=3156892 RepID=UPI0033B2A9DE